MEIKDERVSFQVIRKEVSSVREMLLCDTNKNICALDCFNHRASMQNNWPAVIPPVVFSQ